MDRKDLTAAIRNGPVLIRMHDGSEFVVENLEKALITDIAAHVLYRDEEDQKFRAAILPLVTMAVVQPLVSE